MSQDHAARAMSTSISFPSPQFLAEHQQFVRRLALGLARDEAGADDLVQETWLAALVGGSGKIVNPRAWLATAMRRRAQNAARAEGVRREHETRAARREASEDERLHERVSFQHSLVAAVLELDDPYRSVVMLRYFQGLSPAAIARRRNVPAATVRSQLARALAQLRAKLEQREGGREAWCMALAGFLENSKPAWMSSSAIAIAAGACVLVGGVGAAWVWIQRAPNAIEALVAISEPGAPMNEMPAPEADSMRVSATSNEALVEPTTELEGPTEEALDAESLDELLDMLIRVEDELRPRLLSPPADVVAAWQAQHPGVAMEFARVLEYPKTSLRFDSGAVGVRGGGSFFSFATRSNSYDDAPMISWEGAHLKGMRRTALFDLGLIEPANVPAGLAPAEAQRFAALSIGPALPETTADAGLKALLDDMQYSFSPLVLQHTYLQRQVTPHEHDVLAIFVPIHQDATGITLAYRVLESWPVPERRSVPLNIPPRSKLEPQAWTASMSTGGLLRLVDRIRARTTARLTAVPDALRQQWPDRPFARLLRDFYATRYVDIDGGGRFFNFSTQSNAYNDDPEIDLQVDRLDVNSRPGGGALLLDLGIASALTVGPSFALPDGERSRLLWELAWNFQRTTPPPSGKRPPIDTS